MKFNLHDQIRELLATGGGEDLSINRQNWLRAHLRECPDCRNYEAAIRRMTGALRAEPLIGDATLVRATKERIHIRALELRQKQERTRIVFLCCFFVTLSSAVTTPVFWQLSQWLGVWAGLSAVTWQAGFAIFWITPVLAAGALLMARGTHWTGRENEQWQ